MIERIALIILSVSLVILSIRAHQEEKKLEGQTLFWREMYRSAEHDAQWKRCLELDSTHVICEKE